jgi:hypothetical protein
MASRGPLSRRRDGAALLPADSPPPSPGYADPPLPHREEGDRFLHPTSAPGDPTILLYACSGMRPDAVPRPQGVQSQVSQTPSQLSNWQVFPPQVCGPQL